MFQSKLRVRITVYFLLIFIIPTSAILYLVYESSRKTLTESAQNHLESLITVKSTSLLDWITEEKALIEVLVEIPIIQDSAHLLLSKNSQESEKQKAYKTLLDYLLRVKKRMVDFEEISILSTIGGRTILSTDPSEIGKFHLSDSFFTLGKENTYFQRIFYSKKHKKPIALIATPLKNTSQEIIGVLFARIKPTGLINIMSKTEGLGDTGETFVVDIHHQQVTEHRFPEGENNNKNSHKIESAGINEALKRKNVRGIYRDHHGVGVVGSYHWIEEANIVLAAEISLEEALLPLSNFVKTLLIFSLVVIALTSLVAFYFGNQLTSPIILLSQYANRVAKGDFSKKSTIQSNDELGILSNAFNDMTGQLSELYSNLENIVDQRTTRLETIASLGEYFSSILNADKLVLEIKRVLEKNFDFSKVVIYQFNQNKTKLEITGNSQTENKDLSIAISDNNLVTSAIKHKEITLLANTEKDGVHNSHMAIPILLGEDNMAIGALYVESNGNYELDAGDKNMFRSMASQIAVSINNANIFKSVEQAKLIWEVTFNAIEDGIAIVDSEKRISQSNFTFNTLFSQLNNNRKHPIEIQDIISQFTVYANGSPLKDLFLTNESQTCVYTFHDSIYEVHTYPIKDTENSLDNISRVVFVMRNITEKTRAAMELEEYAEKIVAKNQELQEFTYIASHDLQEPLRKIRTFGERLESKYSKDIPDQGVEFIQRMTNASSRMQTLINGLLEYSRVTTDLDAFETVSLQKIAEEVMSDLEIKIEELHGQVIFESLPDIEADPLQMRQLIQNLVGNALKFHRENVPPVVKISSQISVTKTQSEKYQPNDKLCIITIADNGIGFSAEYREKIFAVFQRLVGKSEYEGSGIGLSICRKIVDRHKGEISVESVPGEGTTFTITLPVSKLATDHSY